MEEIGATYTSRDGSIAPEVRLVHREQQATPGIAVLASANWQAQATGGVSQPQRSQRLDRVSGQVDRQTTVGWASQPFHHDGRDVILIQGAGRGWPGEPAARDKDSTIHQSHPANPSKGPQAGVPDGQALGAPVGSRPRR